MSSVDDRFQAQFAELKQQREAQRAATEPLQSGGGGGTSGGMEARVARLEADMDHVKKTLDRLDRGQDGLRGSASTIGADVARLQERVAHLPSKGFVVTATTTTIALLGALILFADKLRALIGG